MFKLLKYGAGAVLALCLGGFVVFGSDLTSMITTTAKSVQKTVKQSVPLEFELQRAKETVNEILPDLQSQVRMIAEEEVAVARLAKEVKADAARLESQETKLTLLREKMRASQTAFRVGTVDMSRQQMTDHFQARFNHFKQFRLSLEAKQKLLDKRKEGLAAAVAMLDQMRCRQSELKLKVEALAAQHRLIKADQIQSGTLIDGSQLSQADQLLEQIETRLQVAQRVMDYQDDGLQSSDLDLVINEQDVLSEFDAYFGTAVDSSIAKLEANPTDQD
ncbi:signal peptide-containing protein [Mariniblastus sp.]|nr:signal peptide-containing protein [Mariniblastus sp.]